MKNLLALLLVTFVALQVKAGGASGGGGVRPSMDMYRGSNPVLNPMIKKDELVKLVGQDFSGKIVFQHKAVNSVDVKSYSVPLEDFGGDYLEALRKSEVSKDWEKVIKEVADQYNQ